MPALIELAPAPAQLPDYSQTGLMHFPEAMRERMQQKWRIESAFHADFVQMIRRMFPRKVANGILEYLRLKHVEYTSTSGQKADTLPNQLWNWDEHREMSPLEKWNLLEELLAPASREASTQTC
jgi:hypothetical protein